MSGTQRIMKAWSCKVEWSDDADIVYAPTAAKARYTLKLRTANRTCSSRRSAHGARPIETSRCRRSTGWSRI